jgi:hypothetical protein
MHGAFSDTGLPINILLRLVSSIFLEPPYDYRAPVRATSPWPVNPKTPEGRHRVDGLWQLREDRAASR